MSYLAVGVGVELLRCEATHFASSDVSQQQLASSLTSVDLAGCVLGPPAAS
jgi:hypothetical protein